MTAQPKRLLFLCTGNSARSILAEALVKHLGLGRLVAESAGSQPKGAVHPMALETLARHGVPAEKVRSKSWDEFGAADAPHFDAVVTVCDSAARETCPIWPGNPATVHWGIPDPAAVTESETAQREAFEQAYQTLTARIERVAQLSEDELGDLAAALVRIRDADERPEAKG